MDTIQLIAKALCELPPGRVNVLLFRPDTLLVQKYHLIAHVLEEVSVRRRIREVCRQRVVEQAIFPLSPSR